MRHISARGIPTVIVSRTARPGLERDFERWLRRITETAARSRGHIGSDIQPPGPQHPDEWVIVYQFADQDSLDDWLESPVRAQLLTEGAELTDGDASVQRVAMGFGDDPVTAVASFRIRSGQEAQFERCYQDLIDSLETFDGYLRAELFPPVEGVQDETVVVFSFKSRDQLDRWLESDQRSSHLERLDRYLVGERRVNVVGGFGGWFNFGQAKVKTWKQAAIVLLALYPTVLALNEVMDWLVPDVTYVLRVLLGNIAGVAILSWILMPRLTRMLDGWLRR